MNFSCPSYIYIYIYICVYKYIYVYNACIYVLCTMYHVHVYVHVYIYIYTHIYIYMYIIYIYICAYTHRNIALQVESLRQPVPQAKNGQPVPQAKKGQLLQQQLPQFLFFFRTVSQEATRHRFQEDFKVNNSGINKLTNPCYFLLWVLCARGSMNPVSSNCLHMGPTFW